MYRYRYYAITLFYLSVKSATLTCSGEMNHDEDDLHRQHFAGVLQDETDPRETHQEESCRHDAVHDRPRQS